MLRSRSKELDDQLRARLVFEGILLLGSALMAYQAVSDRVVSSYPIFFAYFIFRIPNSIWPLLLDTSSAEYQKLWICTEPIVFIFYILLVRELYRLGAGEV